MKKKRAIRFVIDAIKNISADHHVIKIKYKTSLTELISTEDDWKKFAENLGKGFDVAHIKGKTIIELANTLIDIEEWRGDN